MTAPLLFNPGVVFTPAYFRWPMSELVVAVLEEAPKRTLGVYLTSAYRQGDPQRHGEEKAVDADTIEPLSMEEGQKWAARVQRRMGPDFDVIWHRTEGGEPHLHAESEHAKRRKDWTPPQVARMGVLDAGVRG